MERYFPNPNPRGSKAKFGLLYLMWIWEILDGSRYSTDSLKNSVKVLGIFNWNYIIKFDQIKKKYL